MRSNFFIYLFCVMFSGVNFAEADDAPQLKITTKRENDRVEIKHEKEHTCVSFRSPSGISHAIIQRTDQNWPTRMTVRLHLRGLESLKIGNGTTTISAAVTSHAKDQPVRIWLNDLEDQTLRPKDRYFLSIRKQQASVDSKGPAIDYFDVELPTALFDGNPPTIRIDWIDFYR
ncbi:MAG TPA: hypothetical protein DDZ51_13935 [Planctomycetaceae bacterium]|nr:hypothetical protein [Planctomycetaceae bacterium]